MSSGARPTRHGAKLCSAPTCPNYAGMEGKHFFRFPKEKERCRRWVINARASHLDKTPSTVLYCNNKLCSDHFEHSQFTNDGQDRLNWNAVPSIFPGLSQPPQRIESSRRNISRSSRCVRKAHRDVMSSSSSLNDETEASATARTAIAEDADEDADAQAVADMISVPEDEAEASLPNLDAVPITSSSHKKDKTELTPRKIALQKRLKRLNMKFYRSQKKLMYMQSRIPTRQQCIEYMAHYLSGYSFRFFKMQINMASKSVRGRRWSHHDKSVALSLFHASPETYHVLEKMFCMPSVQTLKKDLRNLEINTGIAKSVVDA